MAVRLKLFGIPQGSSFHKFTWSLAQESTKHHGGTKGAAHELSEMLQGANVNPPNQSWLLTPVALLAFVACQSFASYQSPVMLGKRLVAAHDLNTATVPAKDRWTFQIYLNKGVRALGPLEDVVNAVEAATNFRPAWLHANRLNVLTISFADELSDREAASVREKLRSLGFGQDVRGSTTKFEIARAKMAKNLAAQTPARSLIFRLKDSSGDSRRSGETISAIRRLIPDPILSIDEIAGGMLVLRFAQPLPAVHLNEIIALVETAGLVDWIEIDSHVQPTLIPNDPGFNLQWNLTTSAGGMNATSAWNISTGSPGVVIAVIDTGARFDNAELATRFIAGYDFISNESRARDGDGIDSNPTDEGDWSEPGECGNVSFAPSSWHGSNVAGIIGAAANNGIGIAGVNWGVRIQPVRVLGKCGGSISDIVNGMYWAAGLKVPSVPLNPTPARILNMSLGSTSPSPQCSNAYQTAVNAVRQAGMLIVVAAGNNGREDVGEAGYYEPSGCLGVISVAATDHLGYRAIYSDFSTTFHVSISAPGGDIQYYQDLTAGILSVVDKGLRSAEGPILKWGNGTSQAAPHVSAVAALMLAVQPTLTNDQLIIALLESAKEFPTDANCYRVLLCGAGLLNANAAMVRVATEQFSPLTTLAISTSANPAGVGQTFTVNANVVPSSAKGTITFLVDGTALPWCVAVAITGVTCRVSSDQSILG